MSDHCRYCIYRGNYKECMETPCSYHENWINLQHIKEIKELKNAIISALDSATIGEAENILNSVI